MVQLGQKVKQDVQLSARVRQLRETPRSTRNQSCPHLSAKYPPSRKIGGHLAEAWRTQGQLLDSPNIVFFRTNTLLNFEFRLCSPVPIKKHFGNVTKMASNEN